MNVYTQKLWKWGKQQEGIKKKVNWRWFKEETINIKVHSKSKETIEKTIRAFLRHHWKIVYWWK